MRRNYFLFRKQIRQIAPVLRGRHIQQVFTQRRNEIVIEFSGEQDESLKISVDVAYPYFILENTGRTKQARFGLFKQLCGQQINDLAIQDHDKYIQISLTDYRLDTVFYGRQPNILLYSTDLRLLDSFKEAPGGELPVARKAIHFDETGAAEIESLLKKEAAQKLHFFLKRHFTAFNQTLVREILYRLNIDGETLSGDLPADFAQALSSVFSTLKKELNAEQTFIYFKEDHPQTLSPFHLLHLAGRETIFEKTFADVNEAWRRFAQQKRSDEAFLQLLQKSRRAMNKQKEYLQKTLRKIEEHENLQERKTMAELKGNLLLTFKTEIEKGQTEVVLKNIFSDGAEEISIKLNPSKSVVENATAYFNKFRNIARQREIMDIKKQTYASELQKILDIEKQIEGVRSLPRLNKIYETLADMKIIQVAEKRSSPLSLQYAFNRLILDNEWDIYIGKNGRNNDLLTFQFANKWDIWFHAQGVSGSHVIIHLPRKDYHPPQKIIEKTASLAAANSRARHSSTVPVIYTEVRHVHRIRKAHPGTVSVRNEKVIFVEPLK